jgi:hypothetical protein
MYTFLQLAGIKNDFDLGTWFAIVALPINAVINPLIYSLTHRNQQKIIISKLCYSKVERKRNIVYI